jgi:arylsulfatase A-like enzyme
MTKTSYWGIFRLIFVVFSLYLMGDAFYRWDGFKHYASFSEFMLSVALAAVFLSIVTAIAAFLIWFPYMSLEWLSLHTGWHKQNKFIFLFLPVFLLVSIATWSGKRFMFPLLSTPLQIKIAVFVCVFGASIYFTWLLRNIPGQWTDKIAQWAGIVQNRITPLVWLFGIFVFFSIPAVIYQTWIKDTDGEVSRKISWTSAAGKDQPNIILVTFDAMSARNMSLYGYQRPTTPFISKWANTATVFTKTEAESNFTAPTTSSLMTGKRVWTHLRFSRMRGSPPIKMDTESLPVVLKKNGYYNMAFMVNTIASVDNLGVTGSFDIAPFPTKFMIAQNIVRTIHKVIAPIFSTKFQIHNWFFQEGFITEKLVRILEKDFDATAYPPEKAFNRLIAAIDHGEKPFFAWIHLNPPHGPYLPPEPYKGMFDQSGKMRTLKSQLNERNDLVAYLSMHKQFPAEIDVLRARYDEFIRYCDNQFEGFIEQLRREGKLQNTIIILSTDHGEIFNHNNILHGDTLYEPETHIPLIIKEPDQSKGRIVDNLVEQIDIPATILGLAGIPVPSWMEGRSLIPLLRGEVIESRPAFSMNLEESSSRNNQITLGDIAIWEGDYKLIYSLGKEESMLFNLSDDPDEMKNLVDIETEVGRRLLNLIHENLKRANERISRENETGTGEDEQLNLNE